MNNVTGETLEDVLEYYKEHFPNDMNLKIVYKNKDYNTLFTLTDMTATEILTHKQDNMYLECYVYGYLESEITVYYHYPAIIL